MRDAKNTELLIKRDATIKEAMKQLDSTAEKNLYVVDEGRRLIGAISDGDIRRGLLKGSGLDDGISLVMNSNPKFLLQSDVRRKIKARQIMGRYNIQTLPVLDEARQIIDIMYWLDLYETQNIAEYTRKSNKVFILAGGIGSRLEPFTKILPKPLVPIGNQPILEKIMDKFAFYGFDEFIISVNYKAEMIKLYFNDPEIKDKYGSVQYVREDSPLGTIGSLCLAADRIGESFFISNSDIIIEEDMEKIFHFHKDSGSVLTIVGCLKNSVIPYGVLNTDERGFLMNIDEKPAYRHVINTGLYVAEPEIAGYIAPGEKMDITELIAVLLKEKKPVGIYPVIEEQWFDIGQWAEFEKTRKYFEK